jgi:hypothetical protein
MQFKNNFTYTLAHIVHLALLTLSVSWPRQIAKNLHAKDKLSTVSVSHPHIYKIIGTACLYKTQEGIVEDNTGSPVWVINCLTALRNGFTDIAGEEHWHIVIVI